MKNNLPILLDKFSTVPYYRAMSTSGWLKGHQAKGLCRRCTRRRHPASRVHCEYHLLEARIKNRLHAGCREKRNGGPGRTPLA